MKSASDVIKQHPGEEPRYVNEGEEFSSPAKRPKWMLPNTDLAKRALSTCGRKYYLKGEKGQWIKIEKAMLPLASGQVSVYPSEWVEHLLTWAGKKNKMGTVITFPRLLSAINNEEYKNDFVAKWKGDHKSPSVETKVAEQLQAPPEEPEKFDW